MRNGHAARGVMTVALVAPATFLSPSASAQQEAAQQAPSETALPP